FPPGLIRSPPLTRISEGIRGRPPAPSPEPPPQTHNPTDLRHRRPVAAAPAGPGERRPPADGRVAPTAAVSAPGGRPSPRAVPPVIGRTTRAFPPAPGRATARRDAGSSETAGMYERFTDRARKVMQLANQEAQRFNHEYIGTEHILLGLVKE